MNNIDFCIDDLIPHRGKMKLIQRIITTDTEKATTAAVVSNQWPLCDQDGVFSLILVELIAQTSGVCNGLDRIQKNESDTSQLGWLVGIKKARFFIDIIPVGTEIITYAENRYKFSNFREITGISKIGDDVVCETVLQLFRKD